MGKSGFKQFISLRNQLVAAADHFDEDLKMSSLKANTVFEEMWEQLKLDFKIFNIMDRPNSTNCVTTSKQNGQAREFLRSSQNTAEKDGGRKVCRVCRCEKQHGRLS